MHRSRRHQLFLFAALACGLSLTGCHYRSVSFIADHPTRPYTTLRTQEIDSGFFTETITEQHWDCREVAGRLACRKACDVPGSDWVCPKFSQLSPFMMALIGVR